MGVLMIMCPACHKQHYWFTGSADQRCELCIEKASPALLEDPYENVRAQQTETFVSVMDSLREENSEGLKHLTEKEQEILERFDSHMNYRAVTETLLATINSLRAENERLRKIYDVDYLKQVLDENKLLLKEVEALRKGIYEIDDDCLIEADALAKQRGAK